MTMRLRDEVAIVTGSTSGLGREIATLFAEQGASVVVSGRRVDAGEAVVADLARAPGADHLFVASDLTTPEGREELVDRAVARFGRLTVLVNNAVSPSAIARDGMVTSIDHELWHDMLSVTLVATAEMCRLAIPHLIDAGGGSIVNVSAKSATLAQYRFALCFENSQLKGWITEKLFDCFFAGTVPVYWGAPDILDWVPADCFIDMRRFSDFAELRAFLHALEPSAWHKYREAARDYVESSRFAPFRPAAFVDIIAGVLSADTSLDL